MRYKCATCHPTLPVQFVAIFLLLASVRSLDGGLDCDDEGGSGSGEDWWFENITNGTELCSGMMDFNSSEWIYQNDSSGNGASML